MEKSKTMILLTVMITFSTVPGALAEVLVSADCPESVYAYELFTCKVTLYNDSKTDTVLDHAVHFNKKRAIPISAEEKGETAIPALTKKTVEVNAWAKSMGSDVFVFEHGYGKLDRLYGKVIAITSAPLYLDLDSINVTAGQRNTVKAEIVGKGYFVQLTVDYPPSMIGTSRVDVGDVEGAKPITLEITPDPYAIGTTDIDVYISFSDERGNHTLLQKIPVSVSPSYQLIGAVIVFAAILLAVAFAIHKRSKS
ncbi:MAG TPA: hypothetical protein EYH14_01520 [Euryarchaeota archaeon]|nr:hypothetical protein [Euryarchaeota archaeon]